MYSRCFHEWIIFAVRTLNLPPVVLLLSRSFKCDVMFGINVLLRRRCQIWKQPYLGSSLKNMFVLLQWELVKIKVAPFPPQQALSTFLSAQVKTFSTSRSCHWANSSVRIPVWIQPPSNYVYFISVCGVNNGWYGSGVCDTFFITEGLYRGRLLPLPPMQRWDTRPV